MAKQKEEQEKKPPELTLSDELQKKVDKMIEDSKKDNIIYWDEKITSEIWVPTIHGEIRVLHVKPEKPKNKRPLLFIPGWGVLPGNFDDVYEVLQDEIEFYYLETREKKSSKISRWKAKLTMEEKAWDVKNSIKFLGLEGEDFILAGPCWGSTVIIIGLLKEILDAPTIMLFDPMHKLFFPKALLNMAPIIPAFIVSLVKPILKNMMIGDMEEKNQKERAESLIREAVIWKWKKAAYQARNIELFGKVGEIKKELLVFNGTTDKVHVQTDYPKLAKEIPHARFFFLNTHEVNRERLMGVILKEFAKTSKEEIIPTSIKQFEKELKREEK